MNTKAKESSTNNARTALTIALVRPFMKMEQEGRDGTSSVETAQEIRKLIENHDDEIRKIDLQQPEVGMVSLDWPVFRAMVNGKGLVHIELSEALRLCRFMEPVVSVLGWHVGLTGGCLYKDGFRKDADIILYRHKSAGRNNINAVLDALNRQALFTLTPDEIKAGTYDNSDRIVLIGQYTNPVSGLTFRIDLFLMM